MSTWHCVHLHVAAPVACTARPTAAPMVPIRRPRAGYRVLPYAGAWSSADAPHYVIRGGRQGRERLRMLARVMWPTTHRLLEPLVRPGALPRRRLRWWRRRRSSWRRLAPRVGRRCRRRRREARLSRAARPKAAGWRNVEFRVEDVLAPVDTPERFDVVYARFLLSHLPRPGQAVVAHLHAAPRTRRRDGRRRRRLLGASSVSAVGTRRAIRGSLPPPCEACGADPNIGPRLPGMLRDAGLADVDFRVVQPGGHVEGDVKFLAPITFEAIADALVAQELVHDQGSRAPALEL